MTISSLAAAKKICELSEWSISNLSLQKILYMAHMVHMGRHDGDLLIDETFEAWDYGPVLPSVYHKAKSFGSKPVRNVFRAFPDITDSVELDTLTEATNALAHTSAGKLVAITHWKDGAWAKHYASNSMGTTIPNSDILEEYMARLNDQQG